MLKPVAETCLQQRPLPATGVPRQGEKRADDQDGLKKRDLPEEWTVHREKRGIPLRQ